MALTPFCFRQRPQAATPAAHTAPPAPPAPAPFETSLPIFTAPLAKKPARKPAVRKTRVTLKK